MKKDLYTLEELFEQEGSKFPFNVSWNNKLYIILNKDNSYWFHNYADKNYNGMCHVGYFSCNSKDFESAKKLILDQDIKELLK